MSYKSILSRRSLIIVLCSVMASLQLAAQNINSTLELKELKASDDSRIFGIKLTGENESGAIPVFQAKVDFFTTADGKSELLGSASTDRDGSATFKVEKGTRLLKDKEGISMVTASFQGLGKLNSAEANVKFKEINLQINLSEKDSLNTIQLQASTVGPNGESVPLKETTFNIYVQGLFSKLKIGECFVDAGAGTFEFPKNIPGDSNGNLKIFVRLEENEIYGEVEKTGNAKWGNHRSGFVEPSRSLWSSGAPIWMITTLIILLTGVWSHYLYAIVQLIKIRKEGKKIDQE
ncbi:MAG: hypothetical protein M0R39_16055 [Prolixibacteraceae bacterium]|nr:hypothetical protein [Prolixibacteraceae bacterium]